jgi:hypothetical protein
MDILFKPQSILIKSSASTDIILGRLKREAIIDGNTFQINSRAFDIFYRGCYEVGKVEKSDSGSTISAEIRPTSHIKAVTFILPMTMCAAFILLIFRLSLEESHYRRFSPDS